MHSPVVRLSRRAFPLSVRRATHGLLLGFASISVSAAAGHSIPSTLLVERCRAYSADTLSAAAQACEAYVSGFLAGARTAGWLRDDSGQSLEESFTERAWRTRGPWARRPPEPQVCPPDGLSTSELVAQLLTIADARPDLAEADAARLLETMLRSNYPCKRKPDGSR
jgi:hypothetical protein